MPKKDEWGSAPKTLEILEEVNHRPINSKYLHVLWKNGRLARRAIDRRTFEYNITQARNIQIEEKKGSGRKKVEHDKRKNESDVTS